MEQHKLRQITARNIVEKFLAMECRSLSFPSTLKKYHRKSLHLATIGKRALKCYARSTGLEPNRAITLSKDEFTDFSHDHTYG